MTAVRRFDRVVSSVVRARRDLVKDDRSILHEEKLYAIDTAAIQGLNSLHCKLLGLCAGLLRDTCDFVAMSTLNFLKQGALCCSEADPRSSWAAAGSRVASIGELDTGRTCRADGEVADGVTLMRLHNRVGPDLCVPVRHARQDCAVGALHHGGAAPNGACFIAKIHRSASG